MMTNPLRCLMTGMPAGPLSDDTARALRAGLGGILLFGRNIDDAEQARLLTKSITAANPRALIAVDEEGGGYGHLITAGVPAQVGNLALGTLDDVEVTRNVAFDMACGLAGLGINVDFAPCADVNSNPDNPVIGVRSFGADPGTVARHVGAFVDGLQARGVAACVKHFPGHGDTAVDSHLGLPSGTAELTPFRATSAALMMSAHVVYPELGDRPATLNRDVLTGLARQQTGFGGVIVTDALEMRAISEKYPAPEAAVLALAAGADLVLIGDPVPDTGPFLAAITAAVADGRLPQARLDAAAARVAVLAARFATPPPRPAADGAAGRRAAAALASRQRAEPLGAGCFVIELRVPNPGFRAVHPGLVALARRRDPSADGVTIESAGADLDAVLARAAGRRMLIAAQDRGWIGETLSQLVKARPDATVIHTGLPSDGLNAYGRSPVMLDALLDRLL
jgi:beta-N-acetylhexosaminidase